MSRAPFQVLVIPYFHSSDEILYSLFQRTEQSGGYWQFIAGGGEFGEIPLQGAKREAREESGIEPENEYISLDSMAMIPVPQVNGFKWGPNVLVIPEYCFGVRVLDLRLTLSREHLRYLWAPYQKA